MISAASEVLLARAATASAALITAASATARAAAWQVSTDATPPPPAAAPPTFAIAAASSSSSCGVGSSASGGPKASRIKIVHRSVQEGGARVGGLGGLRRRVDGGGVPRRRVRKLARRGRHPRRRFFPEHVWLTSAEHLRRRRGRRRLVVDGAAVDPRARHLRCGHLRRHRSAHGLAHRTIIGGGPTRRHGVGAAEALRRKELLAGAGLRARCPRRRARGPSAGGCPRRASASREELRLRRLALRGGGVAKRDRGVRGGVEVAEGGAAGGGRAGGRAGAHLPLAPRRDSRDPASSARGRARGGRRPSPRARAAPRGRAAHEPSRGVCASVRRSSPPRPPPPRGRRWRPSRRASSPSRPADGHRDPVLVLLRRARKVALDAHRHVLGPPPRVVGSLACVRDAA